MHRHGLLMSWVGFMEAGWDAGFILDLTGRRIQREERGRGGGSVHCGTKATNCNRKRAYAILHCKFHPGGSEGGDMDSHSFLCR